MRLTRRTFLVSGLASIAAPPLHAEPRMSHGLSRFGDLAYPADFKHFAYVNAHAPKGGVLSTQISSTSGNQTFDTFNTLNIYVLKGDGAAGMGLTFDSLMVRALDEPDAMYGLVAKNVTRDADGLAYRFALRPEAHFHDGSKLTAEDVAFSVMLLKTKGHPAISQSLRLVESAVALGTHEVEVRFQPGHARDLPMMVASLPIFSKAYYSANDFEASTLTPPLGSGPYRIKNLEQGRYIAFERVADYWGRHLPVNVGRHNMDLRFEYFRDRQVAFEALKAQTFNFREEFTSRDWATGYDIPAVREGRIKRETIPDDTPSGAQGWFFNTRRPALRDRRIREALGLLFDFEWTNANIMFNSYKRTQSFFENSDMKAEGAPSPDELQLLEPLRSKLDPIVFGPAVTVPNGDGSGQDRALLRRADTLLKEAGCTRGKDGLLLPDGTRFELEFLDFSPALQPHQAGLLKNMKLVGIEARSRIVDAAQYQRRMDEFDFDITTRRYAFAPNPGENLRQIFGSVAASTRGTPNIAGIADPAIDALVEAALAAQSRAALVTACRTLDRVLRAGRYWIPMWYKGSHWLAYWNRFGRPETKPKYDRGLDTWWYDETRMK
jgi:microcin C transport system substrate-binding protein